MEHSETPGLKEPDNAASWACLGAMCEEPKLATNLLVSERTSLPVPQHRYLSPFLLPAI